MSLIPGPRRSDTSRRFWEEQGLYGGQTVTDLPIRFAYFPNHGFGEPGGVVLARGHRNNPILSC
ncbi:hypothetical protein FOI68_14710 [Brevibacillus sp. LEMMJ03]|nr:hypothetical protein FOI68_14710 [Brevibacillus sp. LEMMJ03]